MHNTGSEAATVTGFHLVYTKVDHYSMFFFIFDYEHFPFDSSDNSKQF